MEGITCNTLVSSLFSLKSKDLNPKVKDIVNARYETLTCPNTLDYLLIALESSYKDSNQEVQEKIQEAIKLQMDIKEGFSHYFFNLAVQHLQSTPSLTVNAEKILACITSIESKRYYSEVNEENELRISFVGLQSLAEEVIVKLTQSSKIDSVAGAIYTRLPATPVCTEEDKAEEMVHEGGKSNPDIVFTVRTRTTIIREFLKTGSILSIVYPSENREERKSKELEIFEQLKNEYRNLKDCPINGEVPDEISGAAYVFNVKNQGRYLFSINSRQAINESKKKEWKLFFGPLDDRVIQFHYNKVRRFLENHGLRLF
ncbi:hypothetical protein SteCoe_22407 [Stentor coeruleus]|uniref:Uncharacterized protein n=1 Tax=Stentor coeruleus TaxID=5963 RepID=A0A1R2BM36_9CILI|nr:hypothetical protein SteCoe_22407 [Stentor coeruleus]